MLDHQQHHQVLINNVGVGASSTWAPLQATGLKLHAHRADLT